jgi:hypothetical protein
VSVPKKKFDENGVQCNFYVYALLDPRKPGKYEYSCSFGKVSFDHEPFYVGKGYAHRISSHERHARNHPEPTQGDLKSNKIRSIHRAQLSVISVKIITDVYEDHAFSTETELIEKIGRFVDGGCLANLCVGGLGQVGNLTSEETRARMRASRSSGTPEERAAKEKKRRDARDYASLIRATLETKAKYTPERRAQVQSKRLATMAAKDDSAKKLRAERAAESMRARNLLSPPAPVTCPHCGKTGSPRGVKKHHFDRCKLKPVAA